jgi:hypothetical protein
VFENRVLRRIFGPKGEVGEDCIMKSFITCMLQERLVGVIKSRRTRLAGHIARMGKINAYSILFGKSEGKRPLGRPRRTWRDNIRMDLRKIW